MAEPWVDARMGDSSPDFRAFSHSKHRMPGVPQGAPGHPYEAGRSDAEPMGCLYSCRVAGSWIRAPTYQLSVFGKLNNSLDFHNAAVYIQASSLQLPVPRV